MSSNLSGLSSATLKYCILSHSESYPRDDASRSLLVSAPPSVLRADTKNLYEPLTAQNPQIKILSDKSDSQNGLSEKPSMVRPDPWPPNRAQGCNCQSRTSRRAPFVVRLSTTSTCRPTNYQGIMPLLPCRESYCKCKWGPRRAQSSFFPVMLLKSTGMGFSHPLSPIPSLILSRAW